MSDQIEKFEAWRTQVASHRESVLKTRQQSVWVLLSSFVVLPFGYFFNPWATFGIFATWLMIGIASVYISVVRADEQLSEMKRLDAEIAKLKESQARE